MLSATIAVSPVKVIPGVIFQLPFERHPRAWEKTYLGKTVQETV